jgi:hypothetical protein
MNQSRDSRWNKSPDDIDADMFSVFGGYCCSQESQPENEMPEKSITPDKSGGEKVPKDHL